MTYRSSQLAKVIFSQNVAETLIWLWWMPLAEFQISDWIFGTPLKFWSGWYITFSIWRCFSSCHNFCHRTLQFMPYMAIAGATGRISNFWLDIQDPLEILVRMIYNIFYLEMFFLHLSQPPSRGCFSSCLIWHGTGTGPADSEPPEDYNYDDI